MADSRNLLDLYPERRVDVDRGEDGLATLLEPKFDGGFLGKHLQPRLKRPFTRIDLDEVGTLVWDACDGSNSVLDIAGKLAERFGADFDPEYKRLALFLQAMKSRGYIEYHDEPI